MRGKCKDEKVACLRGPGREVVEPCGKEIRRQLGATVA